MKKLFVKLIALAFLAGLAFPAGAFSAEPANKPATHQKQAGSTSTKKTLDINTATKDELMTLPGVGEVTAQKIIDSRPYKRKDELVKKGILSEAQYKKISGDIIAKKEKSPTTPK